ncbi:hypothetical protein [Candidatus Epulonipiscium viviparus]|uniref:hypothetical protein n=1 Tax=Candidatus Epulonipiscium viviparus TaxID=420336 RepID=UPI0027381457|nr:hypothetical protein [Candidatus Epulopiscium viviparus]
MKKIIAAMAMVMIALTGCAQSSVIEKQIDMINPIVNVESANEFEMLGIAIKAPEDATNVKYSIIAQVTAQINFDLDNKEYTLRASKQFGGAGLHGIYEEFEEEVSTIETNGKGFSCYTEIMKTKNSGYVVAMSTINIGEEKPIYIALIAEFDALEEEVVPIIEEINKQFI